MSWFLIYPGREEQPSPANTCTERQRVGREETQSRFNSLVNYNLPRGAPSTPLSSSISQKKGMEHEAPGCQALSLQGRLAVVLWGKCELEEWHLQPGVLPAPLHPLLIHASTPPHPPSPAVSWAPRQGLCRGIQNKELARSSLPLGLPGSQHSSSLLLICPYEEPLWPLRAWSTPSESCTQREQGLSSDFHRPGA